MSTAVPYNAQSAIQLAKAQGAQIGGYAGATSQLGTLAAPTAALNQAGYYTMQDTQTGSIFLQKLAPDSTTTGQWYDQVSNSTYDFSKYIGLTDAEKGQLAKITGDKKTYGTSGANNGTDTNSSSGTDAKEITAADIQEMIKDGIYSNPLEALNDVFANGCTISDEEQAKLGIYSADDENKIQSYMETYGVDRQTAIQNLGDKIQPTSQGNDVNQMYQNLLSQGYSEKEAVVNLDRLGITIPQEILFDAEYTYSDSDLDQMISLSLATGCSSEEAAKALNIQPEKRGNWWTSVKSFFGIGVEGDFDKVKKKYGK